MRKKQKKKYEELTFTDDFMFCKILSTNHKLCQELLELILGIKIRKVELVDSQKSVEHSYDGKGVRFDVYANDADNTVYDIEMQTTRQKDLPKRSRYYQGMIDLDLIEKGANYSDLKKSYIIFICLKDIFGKNYPVYAFSNTCKQDQTLELGDEAIKVFINADGSRDGLSKDMCSFLDYLQGKGASSDFTRKLQDSVDEAVSKRKWEVDYMTLDMKIREEREEARIYQLIRTSKKYNVPNEEVVSDLCSEFRLTREEALEALEEYEEE